MLVRKIDRSLWLQTDILNGEDISADAITNCIKTRQNTLSLWKVDSDDHLDEAVLAIVAGYKFLETIDVVPLDYDRLCENGIASISSHGETPVEDLTDKHVDLVCLSYQKLGVVAHHIVEKIKEKKVKRYTIATQKELLRRAISNGRLVEDLLKESVKEKLRS